MPNEGLTIRFVDQQHKRMCRWCGELFIAQSPNHWHCSHACAQRSWRAAMILEGTHGKRADGTWGKLDA